ncbi:MAG: DUF1571 domain-containing protein, partial [Gemmataceae bacterium]
RLFLLLPLCLMMAPDRCPVPLPRSPEHRPPDTASPAAPARANDRMAYLAAKDPVAFVEAAIARYDREVKGYTCLLIKQERLGGTLMPEEQIQCWFCEEPSFRVLMEWTQGARLAHRVLYVKGANDDKLLAKLNGVLALGGTARRDADGPDARSSARYPATEFGLRIGMQRTLDAFKAAQARGELRTVFNGLKTVPELGYPWWELVRPDYPRPEDDGISHAVYYYDPQTWLQVGSVLRDAQGNLIGRYFFCEVKINEPIPETMFVEKALWR